jgi:hypothetical protein
MFGFTEQLTQAISIPVASLFPANVASGSNQVIGPVKVLNFQRFMAHVQAGVLGTSANVQAYLQGSNTNNGTFVNIPNPNNNANVVLTLASNNTEGTIEARADQMPTGNQFIQLVILVNANSSNCAGTLFGAIPSYSPAQQFDYAAILGTNATNTRLVT